MQKYDILVAGEINPDLILSKPGLEPAFGQVEMLVDSADLAIGSSAAIFACGAARLGLRVGFIGVIGDDLFGHFMLSALQKRGVDITPIIIDPSQKTGLSVILNRGSDRAILTHLGAIDALRSEHITDSFLLQTRHFHVASFFLQKKLQVGLIDLFKRAKDNQISTSLDTNWDPHGSWKQVRQLLPYTDIFFPNEAEAMAITTSDNINSAILEISRITHISAIKLGNQGGASVENGQILRVPALMLKIADTVGAGDSFDAGFLYGHLHGWSLKNSLQLAVVCGSLSTRSPGGTEAQPTLEEALQVLNQLQS